MNASTRTGQGFPTAGYHAPAVDHYQALGVPVGSPSPVIRQAYLDAARRHHPDFHVAADEATRARHARQMQVVNEAWAVLGDRSARERYDLSRQLPVGPPTERIRPDRDPETPSGKGWTPRQGDDGWQRDYRSWADDDERLAPDGPGGRRDRGALAVVPVALFAVAVLGVFLGTVLSSRSLVAAGFVAGVASAVLFVMLPIFAMSRGRHRD